MSNNIENLSEPELTDMLRTSCERCVWLLERRQASPQIEYWQVALLQEEGWRDDLFSLLNYYSQVAQAFTGMFKRMTL